MNTEDLFFFWKGHRKGTRLLCLKTLPHFFCLFLVSLCQNKVRPEAEMAESEILGKHRGIKTSIEKLISNHPSPKQVCGALIWGLIIQKPVGRGGLATAAQQKGCGAVSGQGHSPSSWLPQQFWTNPVLPMSLLGRHTISGGIPAPRHSSWGWNNLCVFPCPPKGIS